jgi:hypothetical protein
MERDCPCRKDQLQAGLQGHKPGVLMAGLSHPFVERRETEFYFGKEIW